MRARELLIALAMVAWAPACQRAAKPSAPPDAGAMPSGTAGADDSIDSAEQRIAENATRMRALGLTLGDARRELEAGTKTSDELEHAKDNDAAGSSRATTPPANKPATDPGSPAEPPKLSPSPQPTTPSSPPPPPQLEPELDRDKRSTREHDRCTQICELAEVACGLEQQVCRLANFHVGESRYEDACWRARDQCERGTDACNDCTAC